MHNHNSEHAVDRDVTVYPERLFAGGCDPAHLADLFGTPLLVIDERRLRARMQEFVSAFTRAGWRSHVLYAAKALMLKALARLAHNEGLELDVCSEGELATAIEAGVPAAACTFHGAAKTDRELEMAISSQVGHIVVDNDEELRKLSEIAGKSGLRPRILVRVNIGIAAATKAQIQTGGPASKFGFPVEDGVALKAVKAAAADDVLAFDGIASHIGSQIFDLKSFAEEVSRVVAFAGLVHERLAIACKIVNVGGGLAISDNVREGPSPRDWAYTIFASAEAAVRRCGLQTPDLMVEPGRAVIAGAGTTLYRVAVTKTLANGDHALIVDGGMSDNPRPALYQAAYPVVLATAPYERANQRYTIFGRHCETDLLFRDVLLPKVRSGDLLAVRNTGAYTYSMSSNYNRFPKLGVVLLNGLQARLIAKRESLDHMLALDVLDEPAHHVNQA